MTDAGQPAFTEIRYEVAGGTATMTLHRPDRLNAFTRTMARELIAAFDLADADDAVRVVLLTGAGRGFCAGADLAGGRTTFAGRGETEAGGTIAGVPRDGGGIPAAELIDVARTLADEIAANTSAVPVTLSRRMLWSMLGEPTPWDAHRLDSRAISVLGQGPDVAEGVESFLEKRPPRFPAQVTDYLDVVPEWPAPPADLS